VRLLNQIAESLTASEEPAVVRSHQDRFVLVKSPKLRRALGQSRVLRDTSVTIGSDALTHAERLRCARARQKKAGLVESNSVLEPNIDPGSKKATLTSSHATVGREVIIPHMRSTRS